MRENINSYAPDFYKEEPNVDLKGHLDGLDKIITKEGPIKVDILALLKLCRKAVVI